MAVRIPLVNVSGTISELPSGDTISGAGGASPPTRILTGTTYSQASYTHGVVPSGVVVEANAVLKVEADARVTVI